jgi:transcriptional regulator with XRE-family HTH domain
VTEKRKRRLEAAGFKVGSFQDFLELTPEESAIVFLREAMARQVRRNRHIHKCSQTELARRLGSSQSRIAKLEAAEPDVSLDLLFRALFATGAEAECILGALKETLNFLESESGKKRNGTVLRSIRGKPKAIHA